MDQSQDLLAISITVSHTLRPMTVSFSRLLSDSRRMYLCIVCYPSIWRMWCAGGSLLQCANYLNVYSSTIYFICWHGQMTCWKTQIFSADLGQTCKLSHPAALCNCCPPHIFNSWCCLICSDKTKNLAFNLEYTRDDGTLPTLVSYSACRRFLLPLPWFLLEKSSAHTQTYWTDIKPT